MCALQSVHATTYIIKEGETLSQIAQKKFPQERIYGSNGSLKKILTLNSEIENPNIIYPGQILKLEALQASSQEVIVAKNHDQEVLIAETSDIITQISAGFGGYYYNLKQTGVLGTVDLSLFLINAIELRQKSQIENLTFQTKFRSATIEIESTGQAAQSRRLSSLDLDFLYKNFLTGLRVQQQPLIRRTGTNVDFEVQTPFSVKIGHLFTVQKSSKSSVYFETTFLYLIKNSSGKSDIIFEKKNGFGMNAEFMFERRLKNSDWILSWPVIFNYQNNKTKLTWDNDKGLVKTQELSLYTFLSLNYLF